jgi:hypothetical protein
MNILLSVIWSILSMVIHIWLPGYIILSQFEKNGRWTVSDSFFMGLACLFVVGALAIPFSTSTQSYILIVRSAMIFIVGIFLVIVIIRRWRFGFPKFGERKFLQQVYGYLLEEIQKRVPKYYIFISLSTFMLAFLFVSTHNIGFDDTEHLKYLNDVINKNPFPSFQPLTQRWSAARYPYFGLLLGILSFGITGGVIFIYYFTGCAILINFLLKAFTISLHNSKQYASSIFVFLAIIVVLMYGGSDNYFNYGIYPLQQSKLLFMTGLLFLFHGLRRNGISLDFVIGSALVTLGAVYHLNLVLTYIAVIPFVSCFFFFFTKGKISRLVLVMTLAVFPLITIPSGVNKEIAFLKFEPLPLAKKIEVMKTDEQADEQEPIDEGFIKIFMDDLVSVFEQGKRLVSLPLKWIAVGRYNARYISRSYIYEFFLIASLVFICPYLLKSIRITYLIVIISTIIIVYNIITVVPRQLVLSFFRPGTVSMIVDLNGDEWKRRNQSVFWTDEYTALYLQALYGVQAKSLTAYKQLVAFSPLKKFDSNDSIELLSELDEGDSLVLNGRYWGQPAVHQWMSKTDESTETVLEKYSDFSRGNLFLGNIIVRKFVSLVKEQLTIPVLVEDARILNRPRPGWPEQGFSKDKYQIDKYRDSIFIKIYNVKKNDTVIFYFDYHGDNIKLKKFSGCNKGDLSLIENNSYQTRYFIHEDCGVLSFYFKVSSKEGLGIVKSVRIAIKPKEDICDKSAGRCN